MKNTVGAYPDICVSLFDTYCRGTQGVGGECLDSCTMTEGGKPNAVLYPWQRV